MSEFFVDELAAALGTSVTSASHTWTLNSTLHDRLPGTWRAMADGELDLPRGRAIAAEVARSASTEPMVLLAVEAAVLPGATELTVTRLRARVRAELVAHDALFAERCRRAAERRADTTVRPSSDAPGRAEFAVDLSVEEAYACWDVADQDARAAKAAGDPRPIGVLRCEAVRRRLLGNDTDPDRPPVSAHVTVLAPLDALEAGARPDPAPETPVVLVDAEVTVLGTDRGAGVRHAASPDARRRPDRPAHADRPGERAADHAPAPARAAAAGRRPVPRRPADADRRQPAVRADRSRRRAAHAAEPARAAAPGAGSAAPTTRPAATAGAVWSTGHPRSTATGPALRSTGSCTPATAAAACPAARPAPPGPTSTTSWRTARAARPTATTSAASAAGTTG